MVALGVVALTLAATGSAAMTSVTALKVTYWPNGENERVRETWTLRCNPAGGTVPRPGSACSKLAEGGRKLFAPVPRGAICTEIYGGPDRARVTGVVGGRRVWVTFNLTNGCHIERWSRFSPWLLPPS
ncbi:hypothetical protein BH20ACT13_BH20ACT13_12540 [soil metagenome]